MCSQTYCFKKKKIIRFVVFFSKELLSAKCNYEIYDKKLLIIIKCFEKWKSELQSAIVSIKVFIDHRNLKYFMIIKKLNRKQIRWIEFFADFNFIITYQTEKIHAKANALIKKPENWSENEENDKKNINIKFCCSQINWMMP